MNVCVRVEVKKSGNYNFVNLMQLNFPQKPTRTPDTKEPSPTYTEGPTQDP